MASKPQRDWADLSSNLSSISALSRTRREDPPKAEPVQRTEADEPTASAVRPRRSESGAAEQKGLMTSSPEFLKPTVYRSPARTRQAVRFAEQDNTNDGSPRKRRRPNGPKDLSGGRVFSSGLADIQLPELEWKKRGPPGIRVPEQLVNFGKYNMRFEAHRDLSRDDAFDPYLLDREQSWVANHYQDHLVQAAEDNGGAQIADVAPMIFETRPPSPPLPKNTMENLLVRAQAMVDMYNQVELERDFMRAKQEQLEKEELFLTRHLEALEDEHQALLQQRHVLREECALRVVRIDRSYPRIEDDGEVLRSSHDTVEGDSEQGEDSHLDRFGVVVDGNVSELDRAPTANSAMSGVVHGPINEAQQVWEDMSIQDEQAGDSRVNALRGYFERLEFDG
jgi:hypothetical protein